jgi:DNA mismatch repair protein MutS2
MATRTEQELGWPEILGALAARCRLPAGRRRALSLPFLPTPQDVREALLRVEEARRLSEAGFSLPLGGLADVADHLDRAAKGGVLEPLALRECAALSRAAARTREVLLARAGDLPRLAALAEPLTPSATLADPFQVGLGCDGPQTLKIRGTPFCTRSGIGLLRCSHGREQHRDDTQ